MFVLARKIKAQHVAYLMLRNIDEGLHDIDLAETGRKSFTSTSAKSVREVHRTPTFNIHREETHVHLERDMDFFSINVESGGFGKTVGEH